MNAGLSGGDVALYLAEVPPQDRMRELDFSVLSEGEHLRAKRFILEEKKSSFLVSRLVLRQLLARVLDDDPVALTFESGKYGKPYLSGRHKISGVHFNLSHSGNKIFVGIGTAPLGVDIERMRHDMDCLRFARRFFSSSELVELKHFPDAERCDGFFNGWTRKEAFLKAKGRGLTLGLNQFDTSLGTKTADALLATHYDTADKENWALQGVYVGEDYKAAVAWRGPGILLPVSVFSPEHKKGRLKRPF